ncbi:MAG: hypothetical protein RL020_53 [Pseudomonadota bacterium]|jgi:hypothetical protein
MFSTRKLVLAVACVFPLLASAQDNSAIKQELDALKEKIKQLESSMQKSGNADSQAEADRVRVKVESLEDDREAMGFKGLKVSGFVDPTYIYNKNANTSSFVFMNGFTSQTGEIYTYDNAYFGTALVRMEKELDGGSKMLLEIMPHKSYGSSFNLGSLINQATITIPLTSSRFKFIAGQFGSWPGYEYQLPTAKKTITNNLFFDFTEPTFITGAGLDYTDGKWIYKGIVGNLNSGRDNVTRAPVVHYRVDYSKGEFNGFGFSGLHGQAPANFGAGASFDPATATFVAADSRSHFDYFEADGYFIRGDVTLQGQLDFGRHKKAAFNGGDSQWAGISLLGAYKFTPRVEGILRADYIDNHKNGGGTPNVGLISCADPANLTSCAATGDSANGFGPDLSGTNPDADPNRGAKRTALTLGMNYNWNQNTILKFELRHDRADLPVFLESKTGNFNKSNTIFGASTVMSF